MNQIKNNTMNIQLTTTEKLDIQISVCKDVKNFLECKDIESQVKWLESHLIELKSKALSEKSRLESIIKLDRVKRIAPKRIESLILDYFDIKDLVSFGKKSIEAKHYIWYFLYNYCGMTQEDISKKFKAHGHSTVSTAIKKIKGWVELEDPESLKLVRKVELLISKIQ